MISLRSLVLAAAALLALGEVAGCSSGGSVARDAGREAGPAGGGATGGTAGGSGGGSGGVAGEGGAADAGATDDRGVDTGATADRPDAPDAVSIQDGRDAQGDQNRADAGSLADAARDSSEGGAAGPCPAPPADCRIMPLGDSITFGVGSSNSGGYRVPLFRLARAAQGRIIFVGSQQSGPTTVDNVAFPRQHEGYSGYTIDPGGGRQGISPMVAAALRDSRPHVVTLMIGTNDVNIQLDLATAPQRLGALMDRILDGAPEVTLIVAQIVPSRDAALNQRIMTYNAAIPALVNARVAAGKRIQLVDMYTAFTALSGYQTALLADVLHPNDTGYSRMADVWFAALGPLLR
jgi:lysophospholipase L1-like esterase